jgi:uncharacterized membrane protein
MRRRYIDCARGLAVLLMIEAHTMDAWTGSAAKASIAFRNATILGGFAAPLFLWLAGIGLVFSAMQRMERSGRAAAVEAVCRRGLQIFVLAFLFRLQAFIVSPGSPPVALLRVDILNVMGLAIAMAGILFGLVWTTTARVALYGAAAVATAMITPVARAAMWVDALPAWMQWYVRPAGEHTTFTAFPWIAFVFAGAASGALLAAARDDRSERRLHVAGCAAGSALVALGLGTAAQPSIYGASSFWTSSPTWFAIRVGILIIALAALYAAGRVRHPAMFAWQDALAKLGRRSLFVYWIHVELVYGYASWLWRGSLPVWGTALAAAGFIGVMYCAVLFCDRIAGKSSGAHVEPAPAAALNA